MPYAFVEPQPRGLPEGATIAHYVLELANGARMDQNSYCTQAEAVAAAHAAFHKPLTPKVRNPDKENQNHWQLVDAIPSSWHRSPWRPR